MRECRPHLRSIFDGITLQGLRQRSDQLTECFVYPVKPAQFRERVKKATRLQQRRRIRQSAKVFFRVRPLEPLRRGRSKMKLTTKTLRRAIGGAALATILATAASAQSPSWPTPPAPQAESPPRRRLKVPQRRRPSRLRRSRPPVSGRCSRQSRSIPTICWPTSSWPRPIRLTSWRPRAGCKILRTPRSRATSCSQRCNRSHGTRA